jgi:hypothetical protein
MTYKYYEVYVKEDDLNSMQRPFLIRNFLFEKMATEFASTINGGYVKDVEGDLDTLLSLQWGSMEEIDEFVDVYPELNSYTYEIEYDPNIGSWTELAIEFKQYCPLQRFRDRRLKNIE